MNRLIRRQYKQLRILKPSVNRLLHISHIVRSNIAVRMTVATDDQLQQQFDAIKLTSSKSTDLHYWTDTYKFIHTSTILTVDIITDTAKHSQIDTIRQQYIKTNKSDESVNEHKLYQITVHSTIFHAQGGGQPADQGIIIATEHLDSSTYNDLLSNKHAFIVVHVEKTKIDDNDVILHYGYFNDANNTLQPNTPITQYIDSTQRILNARLHSAGHIIDLAVANAGYNNKLQASKGNHFVTSPYVDYNILADLTPAERSEFVPTVQREVDKLIAAKLQRESYMNDTTRMLGFEGYEKQPCGGTHINNTEELQQVTIVKLEKKGKAFRVKYKVEQ